MTITGLQPHASTHILIAEDSPTQAQRLQHILEQRGYRVTVAVNGHLALEAAHRRKPTVVISDVVMPEMDGYELCKRIKNDAQLSDVPVILVTTLSDPQDVIRGLECRADHFILKPYDENYLLGRVQFVLLNREMRQSEQPGMGLEIFFNGEKHFITADRLQILNLLLSTYEAAMQRNKELTSTQDTLRQTNSELQRLTRDLEDRVLLRTQELEQSNEALRGSQQRFQTLAESLPQLVWTCEPDGRCDYVNPQWIEYTGCPAEEQLGYGWIGQLHPEDRQRAQTEWAKTIVRGGDYDVEFRILREDGTYRWFKSRAIALRDTAGRIAKWFGSNTDFEDFKRSEQKLQTQLVRGDLLNSITQAIGERQDLYSIFQVVVLRLEDHLPIDFGCVCLYDAARGTLSLSSAGIKNPSLALELAAAEPENMDVMHDGLSRCLQGQLEYMPDISATRSRLLRHLADAGLRSVVAAPLVVENKVFGVLLATRHEPSSFNGDECEFLRRLSEHVALAAHQAQLYGALQTAYDDLRRTQQAVMQQERLRALGQMASGVAHDINNAVSPISLYTESLLETEPNLSPRARGYLTTIQRAIDDVAETVARMREFYRPRDAEPHVTTVALNQLVDQVTDLTRARWNDQAQQRGVMIELKTDLSAQLSDIMGSESEIRDALTNLIFNAVDAMPEGGTLAIRTEQITELTITGAEAQRVRLEVKDSGTGMDEETRRRCLEPFFTTKGERGTGLGLAMVYGMAERHGAELEIDSERGCGTTIRVVFPVRAPTPASTVRLSASAAPARPLRILIVDDDAVLLQSLRDTLQSDGHQVTATHGGQAGIDAFLAAQQQQEPFEVVITDLGMPYVDGRKVAQSVRAAAPRTPVVLLTGWGQRLLADDERLPQVDHILSKPPRLHELRETLARCAQQA
ncbi:MAG TPA: response regulator [Steroidobacteraceae bacterium]|jgi:PAS domain S-box-containing protein